MIEKSKKLLPQVRCRVSHEERSKIYSLYAESTCRSFNEYSRKVLLEKPVVIIHRNQSAEEALTEMIQLKKDLETAIKNLSGDNESSKQVLMTRFEETCLRMNQIYELWSRI